MQKAETSTIDAKKEVEKPTLSKLLEISVDSENKIYVNWPTDKKELTIVALSEAIKLVETYRKPQVIKPKPKFMDFVRGVKR